MDVAAPTSTDYARHSAYSDPGPHASLLGAVAPDRASVASAARRVVVHYRAGRPALTQEQRADPDRRWLASILDAAAARQPGPLDAPRDLGRQVAGCCRDHTLFSVGVLREHGVRARSRVGFARYFEPSFRHEHAVVETWDGDRWVRWDPALERAARWGFDVEDMPVGPVAPFETAAEVWRAIRSGTADPASYGVDSSLPQVGGQALVRESVLVELAHRQRDELLLWDMWGPMLRSPALAGLVARARLAAPDIDADTFDALVDEIAAMLVAADAGDASAEAKLAQRYASDPLLRPGDRVVTASQSGRTGVTDLRTCSTQWFSAPPAP
ncbi:transglutaminase domain-containing protein [Xylanimonas sp. McL0601]|uniref:transglutaminase domain-containing protein n=1 Tax=Xylanimonas sp. McL0601 TaxID=3414739 RepID=UPI003CF413D1